MKHLVLAVLAALVATAALLTAAPVSADTAYAFTGTFTDTECGPRHGFDVATGQQSITVAASSVTPSDDITMHLYYGGSEVMHQDFLTSPEVMIYSPGGEIAAGRYEVQVCPFQPQLLFVSGTYALTVTVAPVPLPEEGSGTAEDCVVETLSYDTGGAAASGFPDDPLYARQWGLTQIKAPAAWARGVTGVGVTIAVLDTGVDLKHPDLRPKLVKGTDIVDGDKACPRGPQDQHGHGTHVAGIAAAVTDNGIGVAGSAPDAKIMPVRVLDAGGSGSLEDIAEGIRWAADHKAKVINLSLGELPVVGQLEVINQELEDAINYAWSKGAVVVAAAGNETFPLCSYPSFADRAICVGATGPQGLPSWYSNFPNNKTMLGFRAPGGFGTVFCEDDLDVWSTVWPGSDSDCQGDGLLNGYETFAGTSMATPYVAGVVALLFGEGLTNQQIVDRLKATSSNHGVYDPVMGWGIVDADAATR
jgi:subtilisin family serine protease